MRHDRRGPPRLFGGRRRTDLVFTVGFIITVIGLAVFVVFTSFQQSRTIEASRVADEQRSQIIEDLRRQNELLVCFATDTNAVNLAVAEAVLAGNPGDANARAALARIKEAQIRLSAIRNFSENAPSACPS